MKKATDQLQQEHGDGPERDELRRRIHEGVDSPSVSAEEMWARLERRMDEFEQQQR